MSDIPQYSPERYWGKAPEEELKAATEVLEREGVEAFAKHFAGKFDFTREENRADWRFAVMVDKKSRVLDLGAGLGRISIPLARVAGEVVSVDLSLTRMRFLKVLAAQNNLTNITPVVGDLYDLPFAENSFDLVVMNGVLEWVGMTERYENPREAQLAALRHCRKWLKSGGHLYIGIENRWAFSYLRGRDHGGLRFTNYMPRVLADWYSRLRKGAGYQTYTYGARGYRKLLRKAGFGTSEIYLVYPGYNLPRIMLPYHNLAILRYTIKTLTHSPLLRLLADMPGLLRLYRWGFFSYNIFAKK